MNYLSIFHNIRDNVSLETAIKCGFISEAKDELIDPLYNCVSDSYSPQKINPDTHVFFYPGCFTTVHKGHREVVRNIYKEARKQNLKDFVVIVSPSNISYVRSKYPEHNSFNVNKNRVLDLKEFIYNLDESFEQDFLEEDERAVFIDFNSMFNSKEELNFLFSLDSVLNQLGITHLNNPPTIVCGKDTDFRLLEQYTNRVKVMYVETGKENISSRNEVKINPFVKKTCVFRCSTEEQFNLFKEYLGEYYSNIIPSYLEDERKKVLELTEKLSKERKVITICKEYADILPYHKVSRVTQLYDTYFSLSYNYKKSLIGEDCYIIDSDVYTGFTKRLIERCQEFKQKVIPVLEYHETLGETDSKVFYNTDTYDIVDVGDLLDPKFAYPYVDVSYRTSLPQFDLKLHEQFSTLKKKLVELK